MVRKKGKKFSRCFLDCREGGSRGNSLGAYTPCKGPTKKERFLLRLYIVMISSSWARKVGRFPCPLHFTNNMTGLNSLVISKSISLNHIENKGKEILFMPSRKFSDKQTMSESFIYVLVLHHFEARNQRGKHCFAL